MRPRVLTDITDGGAYWTTSGNVTPATYSSASTILSNSN